MQRSSPPVLLLGKQSSFLKCQTSRMLLKMQLFLYWDNLGKEKTAIIQDFIDRARGKG